MTPEMDEFRPLSFVAEMASALQVLAGANLPSHTTPLPGLVAYRQKLGKLGVKPMWQKILKGYSKTH